MLYFLHKFITVVPIVFLNFFKLHNIIYKDYYFRRGPDPQDFRERVKFWVN